MGRIVIFEPNPYHSEVIPGIAKYFEDLFYTVDIYIRKEVVPFDVFTRYKPSGNIVPYEPKDIHSVFSDVNMQKYDFIFFSSMEHNENRRISRFLDELDSPPATRYGVLGMYHTNYLADNPDDRELLRQGRLFCMASFQKTARLPLSVLVPMYFGEAGLARAKGNSRKRILIIGSSYDIFTLNKAYWKLSKAERGMLEIIQVGTVLRRRKGIGGLARECAKKALSILDKRFLPAPLSYKGKISFPEMFDEIEKSDYLLLAMDPSKNENQRHFMESSVSGSRQLALGFGKPMIIHSDIARVYFIDNAYVPFESGKLHVALRKALAITSQGYNKIQDDLRKNTNSLYNESYSNIKAVIKTMEKES